MRPSSIGGSEMPAALYPGSAASTLGRPAGTLSGSAQTWRVGGRVGELVGEVREWGSV